MKSFETPNLVVSKCLEHDHCRYDGTMISDAVVRKLKDYVHFVTLCPEMDIGLPSPRQALRLVESEGEIKLIFSLTGEDSTAQMKAYTENRIEELKHLALDGFILKGRSPTCGTKDVKLYKSFGKSQVIPKKAKGLFGEAVIGTFGHLPIEDEGRLKNYQIREHFYTGIFTHADFRKVKQARKMADLVQFHSECKYLFMAYNQNLLKQMGKLVANHQQASVDEILESYERLLNKLLKSEPKPMQFVNVMLHIFGYFSKSLNSREKAYFLDAIEQYTQQQIPLSSVMSILWTWVVRFDDSYLAIQRIFEPFPKHLIQVTDSGKGI